MGISEPCSLPARYFFFQLLFNWLYKKTMTSQVTFNIFNRVFTAMELEDALADYHVEDPRFLPCLLPG